MLSNLLIHKFIIHLHLSQGNSHCDYKVNYHINCILSKRTMTNRKQHCLQAKGCKALTVNIYTSKFIDEFYKNIVYFPKISYIQNDTSDNLINYQCIVINLLMSYKNNQRVKKSIPKDFYESTSKREGYNQEITFYTKNMILINKHTQMSEFNFDIYYEQNLNSKSTKFCSSYISKETKCILEQSAILSVSQNQVCVISEDQIKQSTRTIADGHRNKNAFSNFQLNKCRDRENSKGLFQLIQLYVCMRCHFGNLC
ncbi:unnamed protein product (macronuclear) [Paramecium tetraurelia]|uniref:Transmembrane protein n=1 Tax=Paramecium tetraurelia TaxID=5888 RepID=A0EGC3_PARTE|nr:uncharacterized protein GSPATT00026688001 [Paramecium tetraurelia]CAK94364.1 unnamed protein product [Paramecium tetraurelia]|eukprot:XP_001461737.1 hypothetical protein (macronuclear) [Paramecium tetraurelia strain d4-2]